MKCFLICFSLFLCTPCFSQKHETGLSLGATNYKGDYTNDNFELKNYRPAALLFYKNNITPAFGIRYHAMIGWIGANDKNSSDPVYQKRGMSFQKTLIEVAVQLEYNFLNYRSMTNRFKWTPYFLGGLGIVYSPNGNMVQPCIPIGVGLRFIVKENWNIGVEAAARKMFTDALDDLSGDDYAVNTNTQDWYLYNGITISYTFYDVYCPRPRR
jgi:hypothetical protein